MVAVSLLTMGLLGTLALLSKSFYLNRNAADNTTATYLAAEGIELTKNIIDHDVFTGLALSGTPNWGTTCFNPVFPQGYRVDYTTTGCPQKLTGGVTAILNYDPTGHRYSYGLGSPSRFSRVIRVTRPSANEIEVQSIVTWSSGLIASQSLILDDHFYNWR